MLISTVDLKVDYKVLGLVQGNSLRARHLGRDIMAEIRKLTGGQVTEYKAMVDDAREEAIRQMVAEAEKLGANAVIGFRLASATVTTGVAALTAYGTAVKI